VESSDKGHNKTAAKRMLFYSHDSYGLGNIRRMVAIAEFLVEREPDLQILLLTGSSMLHAFRTHPQIDYVKLPCMQRDCHGHYQGKLSCLGNKQLLKLRRKLIKQSIKHFNPDLLLIDKKPLGLGNELCDSFEYLAHKKHHPRRVLLLRDILDQPEVTSAIWQKNGYYPVIEQHYDMVAIAGQASVFDAVARYQFPESVRGKTRYVGYLERPVPAQANDQSEQFFDDTPHKKVLVAAGGGNDGFLILKAYLDGLRQVTWSGQLQSLLVCGPEMSAQHVTQLEALAEGRPKIRLITFSPKFINCLQQADLVVSMGGYNTLCEILSLAKPAIVIPRIEPVAEQLIRAECLNRLELISYIHPYQLNGTVLMEKVHSQLFSPTPPLTTDSIELNGMENIQQLLINLMD
jgi:predicted glycosyltransferase